MSEIIKLGAEKKIEKKIIELIGEKIIKDPVIYEEVNRLISEICKEKIDRGIPHEVEDCIDYNWLELVPIFSKRLEERLKL
ncbi:MAG: hypothetical protein QW803_12095 [Candidatus Methanomethylicia archaeon]